MSAVNFLSGLVQPVANLIDDIHTSDEERLQVKSKLFEMQTSMASQVMDYEVLVFRDEWPRHTALMQRNWRPITMLVFLGLVVADTFGLTEFRLAEESWTLLQIGLGGYVVGRSAEKIVPKVTDVMWRE